MVKMSRQMLFTLPNKLHNSDVVGIYVFLKSSIIAIDKLVQYNNITVICRFEDLRIRREKKKEGRKSCMALDKSNVRDTKQDKVACLLFTATVETERGTVECSAMSSPISLSKGTDRLNCQSLYDLCAHV